MAKAGSVSIKQEITNVCKAKDEGILSMKGSVTMERINMFSWPMVVSETEDRMPIPTSFLHGSMPSLKLMKKIVQCKADTADRYCFIWIQKVTAFTFCIYLHQMPNFSTWYKPQNIITAHKCQSDIQISSATQPPSHIHNKLFISL